MALSVIFDGLPLHGGSSYSITNGQQGIDLGSQAVADALLSGFHRPEEFDQVAAEVTLTRTVTWTQQIRASSMDQARSLEQAITSRISAASRFLTPAKALVITPDGSTHVSTLRVIGGSWQSNYDQVQTQNLVIQGTLTLICEWPVYGAAQNLGSSGAPLVTNTVSPAAFTLTPNPAGDVPADVILFVKNRSASSIRSLLATVVNGNTSWVALSPQSGWTVGASGNRVGSAITVSPSDTTTVLPVASFTSPALPSDRLFRIMLRADQQGSTAAASWRVRVVTGQAEAIGEWRTPPSFGVFTTQLYLADMGAFMFPVSEVGSLGSGSTTTTVFVESRGNDANTVVARVYDIAFYPDDSTILVETSDTSRVVAVAAQVVQLESDQIYDAAGNPAGGVMTGWRFKVLGTSRGYVYTSQQYQANMSVGAGYAPENVDVWATITPRYLHFA